MARFTFVPTLCSTLSHTYFPLILSFSLWKEEPHNGGFGFVLCLSQNPHMVEKLLFSFRKIYSTKCRTNPNLTILLTYILQWLCQLKLT